jgi:hypothetical protein
MIIVLLRNTPYTSLEKGSHYGWLISLANGLICSLPRMIGIINIEIPTAKSGLAATKNVKLRPKLTIVGLLLTHVWYWTRLN